jgi:hypothetical protein
MLSRGEEAYEKVMEYAKMEEDVSKGTVVGYDIKRDVI